VEVQFVANLPYDGLYDALQVGRVDVVISALVIDPARMADFVYSAAYFDAGQVLVVRREETAIEAMAIETMDDLEGCTLAVEFGTQGDMEGRRWARRLTGLTVVPYQTAAEALDAVAAGEAQAALVDHVSALIGTQAQEGLAVVGDPVVGEPYAVAVHRDSRHLLKAIDQALVAMEADGTMERLMAEWLKGGP
jgi:polar amino acid transport system substrate-binding protein